MVNKWVRNLKVKFTLARACIVIFFIKIRVGFCLDKLLLILQEFIATNKVTSL